MKILYATTNNGKINELKKIIRLKKLDAEVIELNSINFNEEFVETGSTFEENSNIKAELVRNFCIKNNIEFEMILADDGGMCIDYLRR
ncbi:MAG: hypothetical protein IKM97_03695 [Clostridia bacterium]|nr:hypothetical protein [Clostridia bacterium]